MKYSIYLFHMHSKVPDLLILVKLKGTRIEFVLLTIAFISVIVPFYGCNSLFNRDVRKEIMIIDTLVIGDFETNCYCLRSDENSCDCVLIDTGLDDTELVNYFEEKEFTPLALILTHGHIDHIAGIDALREKFPDIKVYIHKLDSESLTDPMSNLSFMSGSMFKTEPADSLVEEGDVVEYAGIKLQVLHTPGHTPGGISLYSQEDGVVFSGDALFADSVGRTDFPGGNTFQLMESIKEKLLTLPEETKVLPGHGPATTIAKEKKYNQYLL